LKLKEDTSTIEAELKILNNNAAKILNISEYEENDELKLILQPQ